MTLSDFFILGEKEKKHTIVQQGLLVAKRKTDLYYYFLFKMDSYYVELMGNKALKTIECYTVYQSPIGNHLHLYGGEFNNLISD